LFFYLSGTTPKTMLKNYFFITLLFITTTLSFSQNLFTNGNFEDYYNCPNNFGQANQLKGCVHTHDTPDYYNCSVYPAQANNGTGSMYLGSVKYNTTVTYEGVNLELDSPLEIGKEYTISIAVNYGAKYYASGYVANKYLGCYTLRFDFSTNAGNTNIPNNYSYELDAESVQTNENTTYHTYSFTFTATQASTHLYIVTTPTSKTMNNDPECKGTVFYHLIDDLSIIRTDLLGVETVKATTYSIYPNPTNDNVYVRFINTTPQKIEVFNALGQKITSKIQPSPQQNTILIKLDQLPKGIYFIKINNEIKKIVKR